MSKSRKKQKQARPQDHGIGLWPERRFVGRAVGLIALLILMTYARSFSFGFVDFDDPDLLLNNPAVQSLSPGTIFTPEMGKTYQPLRVLSYALDHSIWGFSPAGYHVENTIWHAAAACFLLLFLLRLLPLLRPGASLQQNRGLALVVALCFALHPVSVESVAWVTSRKYGLLGTFAFLGLWLYCEFRKRGGVGWLVGAVIAAVCTSLSSPFGVVMPALILMVEFAQDKKADWRLCLPFALCLLPAIPLLGNAAVTGPDADYDVIKTSVGLLWFPQALAVIGMYLRNLLAPFWLNASTVNHIDYADVAILICVVVALLFYGIWWAVREFRKGRKLPVFCLLWFGIILLPVSGLVPISTLHADRYLYLPQVGIWLLVGHLLALRIPQKAVLPLTTALALMLIAGSNLRSGIWRDSISLWADCVAKDDRNYRAHSSLASNYADAGQHELARLHFEAAIERNPQDAFAYYNMGLMLVGQGQHAAAREQFLQAATLRPDKLDAWANLAAASRDLNDWPAVIKFANEALSRNPHLILPIIHRATAHAALNQVEDAHRDFESAIALDANSAKAHFGLAGLQMKQGQLDAAIESYKSAATLLPGEFGVHTNLGNAYHKAGRFVEAVGSYRQALSIQEHPGVYQNLAAALDKLGQTEEAAAARAQVKRLQP